MSVLLRPGVLDSPYQRIRCDENEYDGPLDMSVASEGPSQTYPGCFGLPYQDHNYGAQPPPTPPQTPPLVATPIKESEMKEDIVVTSEVPSNPQPVSSPLPQESVDQDDPTRCICDFIHDDGYMIQCDKCSVWQHIVCMGLDRDSIPDVYFCEECKPRPVDRARAREFQIRKREFLKTLVIKSHDSSTDTDPEEVNNRLKAYGLDPGSNMKQKQKIKLKKRKERTNSRTTKRLKSKELKTEKENTSNEANRKNKLLIKDFSTKTAQQRKEKLSKKIERMRAERLSKEMLEDKFSSDDLRDDEKIINTISSPVVHDENAQNPWDISSFNEWEQSYECARYNQYSTYVQEYLNSSCINGHHNDIADLVTDGLRVQRCSVKDLKNKRKGLESSCAIPNGQPIIEVIGKVMTKQQYEKDNFGQRQLSPFVFFYGAVFDLDLVIDASDYGNDARFIRRSCQPNATVHHVVAGGQAHFITVATKEIPEHTEITIPFDYDYKKWNFCVECACLRNNCPVTRYQKRRLRFQKMQNGEVSPKKQQKLPKLTIKSPVRSPTKSPVRSPVKSPDKQPDLLSPTPETIHVSPTVTSPAKMVRRSQVTKSGSNASTQASSGRLRSLRVPSQNKDSATVTEPLTVPEPTALRSSEVDSTLTSPESGKDSSTKEIHETPKPEEKKKLTREERKMEAIMKAFEKMEKRSARKASVDHQNKQKELQKDKVKEEKDTKKEVKKEKEKQSHQKDGTEKVKEEPKEEKEESKINSPEKLVSVKAEVKEEPMEVVEDQIKEEKPEVKEDTSKPNLRERPLQSAKGKKAKKAGGRRRVRNASGAGSVDTPVESQEENSNSMPVQAASCPSTPATGLGDPLGADTPPCFRFLKTKRHLMNEWLSEKSEGNSKPSKSEPLEVTVEESMFVTCLPSPRNSMDRLRRNSQTSGVRERSSSVHGESNAGSAKKRWLRQAMGEGSETSTSPVPGSGGQSPNPQAPALHSPGGSPPADFVTPLKKRRLVRESMSHDSVSNDSPAATPTPSVQVSAPFGYFSSLDTFETYKNKNGLNLFFSPVKPDDNELKFEECEAMEVSTEENRCEADNDALSVKAEPAEREAVSATDSCASGTVASREGGKDGVCSCSEDIDGPDSGHTGTIHSPVSEQDDVQISNNDVKSSSDTEARTLANSEQTSVCDQLCISAKVNTLEPDSSDSVCVSTKHRSEVECDSGTSDLAAQSSEQISDPVVTGEVDSTQSVSTQHTDQRIVTSAGQSSQIENNQCDSCNSERRDSTDSLIQPEPSPQDSGSIDGLAVPGPSSAVDKLCSSSSLSSSKSYTGVPGNQASSHNLDKLSLVDSSTDKPGSQTNSVSGSVLEPVVITNSSSPAVASNNTTQPLIDNEVSNSLNFDSFQSSFSTLPLKSSNLAESFSVTSNSSIDVAPTQNRHLKFLNDSNYGTDMTVDSTTQFVSGVGATNLLSSSGFPAAANYDSDSMDVTSASEPGFGFGTDDSRRLSEDSLNSFPEALSSTSSESQQPKEKKKVSLQEYLKRKKDKTSTATASTVAPVPPSAPTAGSSKSTVSSTTTTSPLKLSTPITLEKLEKKLPPLPSLPSLPMFEKSERKEFKSSSDLLSPIFSRKEKQEEVRKPMSLSERLRQEFGLDDTENDPESDNKPETTIKSQGSTDKDAPPPPPPPPPQGINRPGRVTNGTVSSPLVNMKPFTSGLMKPGDSPVGNQGTSVPHMVPPPPPGSGSKSALSLGTSPGASNNSKSPLQSTGLSNLLSNVKSPQQIKNDLTAQLAAIKAQLSIVQQSLPSSSNMMPVSTEQPTVGLSNGVTPPTSTVPQVFDYGHQSSATFVRQNSCPGSTNVVKGGSGGSAKKNFQGYNKTPPPTGNSYMGTNSLTQNGPASFNNFRDKSPSGWNHKVSGSNSINGNKKYPPSNRKPFNKQLSHKY